MYYGDTGEFFYNNHYFELHLGSSDSREQKIRKYIFKEELKKQKEEELKKQREKETKENEEYARKLRELLELKPLDEDIQETLKDMNDFLEIGKKIVEFQKRITFLKNKKR